MTESLSPGDEADLLRAALDPATPPAQLAAIAEQLFLTADPDYERPRSGSDFLRDIGRQGPLAVLLDRTPPALAAALVANPNTPREHLLHFAADFPEEFLNNPVLMLLLLEHPDLFRQMEPLRLLAFLRNPGIPADLLGTIRASASEAVRDAIRLHAGQAGAGAGDWQAAARRELERLPTPGIDGQQPLIEHLALGTIPAWLLRRLGQAPDQHIRDAIHNAAAVLAGDLAPAPAFELNARQFDPAAIAAAPVAERKLAAESRDPAVLRSLADD
ncbi:MAG TPA: hypothetical protein VD886_16400, partial [Herpetosiphonaceae bacterium]|nr:hypothetical protein [Herpetosiphonaceae bacterium]